MYNPAIDAYRTSQVTTADRGELLLALHDGALRYAVQAQAAIAAKDVAAKGRACDALLAIIMEFSRTLNGAEIPQLAGNLQQLYAYFIKRVNEASYSLDPAPLAEVQKHLGQLRNTWSEAVSVARREGALGAAP